MLVRFFDLKQTLKRLEVKDKELADYCGVKERTVSRWKAKPEEMTTMARKCTQQFLLFHNVRNTEQMRETQSQSPKDRPTRTRGLGGTG